MANLLDWNWLIFSNVTALTNFFEGMRKWHGQAILENVRKLEYVVNTLDQDSVAGARLVLEILAPTKVRDSAVDGKHLRLPNVKYLNLTFKINRGFSGEDLFNDPADPIVNGLAMGFLTSHVNNVMVEGLTSSWMFMLN